MTLDSPADAIVRLAVYGTLAPGRANHHHVADLRGTWMPGYVRGRLVEAGWGAAMGYPGLILDPAAVFDRVSLPGHFERQDRRDNMSEEIAVQILTSQDLPDHWARLDAFEGPGYQRRVAQCATATGMIAVNIYTLADKAASD